MPFCQPWKLDGPAGRAGTVRERVCVIDAADERPQIRLHVATNGLRIPLIGGIVTVVTVYENGVDSYLPIAEHRVRESAKASRSSAFRSR
jgi:hypothetical protein